MKKLRQATGRAFGILNPCGDLWTYETFRDERAARDHVEAFWRGTTTMDTSRFKVVPVTVIVRVRPTPPSTGAEK